MEKFVLVPIAQGTEEMEAVTIIDMLRRAKINVRVAGENEVITCSRGVKIIPDILIQNIDPDDDFDAIVLPGGSEGVNRLMENDHLEMILKKHAEQNKVIGAICAAPLILDSFKIIKHGTKITSHPGVKSQLSSNYDYSEDKVVISENIITSRGAGTAIDFTISIIGRLADDETAEKIAVQIVY